MILIAGQVLFVIGSKVGERHFTAPALDQAWNYTLDLKHFHEASHGLSIAPLLVATEAPQQSIQVQGTLHDYGLVRPLRASGIDLTAAVQHCLSFFEASGIEAHVWEQGRYLPTPPIIQATRALLARYEAGVKGTPAPVLSFGNSPCTPGTSARTRAQANPGILPMKRPRWACMVHR